MIIAQQANDAILSVKDIVTIVVTLILGGSGWAAIHKFFVRPRITLETEAQLTVKIFREAHRDKIEAGLRSQGVPTAFFEVRWANRGRRASKAITIDVESQAEIIVWEVTPPRTDVAAAWKTLLDPSVEGADKKRVRLEQERLMPGAKCKLVVGYNDAPGMQRPQVRAYVQDRKLSARKAEEQTVASVTVIGMVQGFAIALMLTVLRTPGESVGYSWKNLDLVTVAWTAGLAVLVGVGGGIFWWVRSRKQTDDA